MMQASRCRRQSLGSALVILLLVTNVHADRLFTSGFETNNLTATEYNSNNAEGPETSPVHSGTYSLEISPASGNKQTARRLASAVTSGTLWFRFYFNITTTVSVDECEIALTRSGSGTRAYDVYIDTTGGSFIGIKNRVPGSPTTAVGSANLSTATWYRVEVRHLLSDPVGEIELRLYAGDSTTALDTISFTAQDTLPTNIQEFLLGNLTNCTYDINYDDVAVNNNSGTFQNSWPGPGKIFRVTAGSDNTTTWTKAGANCSGTTNTDCVDDLGLPDDASGYNTSSTANNEDRLDSTTLGAEVPSDADMVLVHLFGRWGGSGTTGTRTGRLLLWDESGTPTNGPTTTGANSCDFSGWPGISPTSDLLVFDLGTRSKANVDSFDWGYEPLNSAECQVTAIWANVEWNDAPPAAQATMPPRLVTWQ